MRTLGLLMVGVFACAIGLTLLDTTGVTFTNGILTGLWNAANLLTTLGDFTDFNVKQQVFMFGAMFLFIVIGGYGITQLTGLLSSEEVMAYRENRVAERSLDGLNGHVIVIGFGPLGEQVAARLAAAGTPFVVVESDSELAARAAGLDYLVVEGDASVDDAAVKRARVETADALILAIVEPDRKLSMTLIAHSHNPHLKIITTGLNAHRADLLKRAGATTVVIAEDLVASAMIEQLSTPNHR